MFILLPTVYTHAEGLVPSCNTGAINATTGQYENPCNFDTVMDLINKTIDFLLFYFATPLAAIALCYAGFKLLTAGGSPEQMTKAKHIIRNVIIGYILALGAWLIVNTIFSTLGFKGNTFLKDQDIANTEVTPPSIATPIPQPIAQVPSKDDSGVLFIGGSYTEENPNGDTCNNPDSKPLPGSGNYTDPNNYNYPNFNSYIGPTKVYAGELTEAQKKVQQARLRASEFRQANCWLIDWYSRRKVDNPKLQAKLDSLRSKFLERLKTPKFIILDAKTYEAEYDKDSNGTSTQEGNFTFSISPGTMYIKNSGESIFYTAIHELAHNVENNGQTIPNEQTQFISKLIPVDYIEKYFKDFIEADPKYWQGQKDGSYLHTTTSITLIDKFYDSYSGPQYYYCYVIRAQGISNKPCYTTHRYVDRKIGPNLQEDTSFRYTFITSPASYRENLTSALGSWDSLTYTEIDARLMVLRNVAGARPDKPFPINYSFPKSHDRQGQFVYEFDYYNLRIPYDEMMISQKGIKPWAWPTRWASDPSGNTNISDILTVVGIPIIAGHKCEEQKIKTGSMNISDPKSYKINCKEINADGSYSLNSPSYQFNWDSEAVNWMFKLIYQNTRSLLDNTI